ncbi:hypothetical protein DFJ77DRAFT_444138 [Powellomyces hirtus]|nr:hypothetical protein DFJ77DRAFT_444138 [Powellomyces hirtus]
MYIKRADSFPTPRPSSAESRQTPVPRRLTSQPSVAPAKKALDTKSTARTLVTRATLKVGGPAPTATPTTLVAPRKSSPVIIRAVPTQTNTNTTNTSKFSKSPTSSGSASDASDFSSASSSRSGSAVPKLQRAVTAAPVQPPRGAAKRPAMASKTTGIIKVKIPGNNNAGSSPPLHTTPTAAPAAESAGKCRNCRQRGPAFDPVAMEIQANDKALRKIMDLEISNTSLLAVNTSLENTIRQQSQEMEAMRKELERLRDSAVNSMSNISMTDRTPRDSSPSRISINSTPDATVDSILDADALIKEDGNVELRFSRICAMIQQMVEDGTKAVEYQAPSHPPVPTVQQEPGHAIDIETQARKALARKESRGALIRAAGALRKQTSSPTNPEPSVLRMARSVVVETVPVVTKVTRKSSRNSNSSDVSHTSSSSHSSAASTQHTPKADAATRRRGSVVMRPFVDSPAHAYLDDPYAMLDNPPPVNAYLAPNKRTDTSPSTRITARPDDMDSLLWG